MQDESNESTAEVVDIFSKKKAKKAELIIQDLDAIAKVLDLTYQALYHYKHYVSAAEMMFVANENLHILSAHKKKYQEMLENKD